VQRRVGRFFATEFNARISLLQRMRIETTAAVLRKPIAFTPHLLSNSAVPILAGTLHFTRTRLVGVVPAKIVVLPETTNHHGIRILLSYSSLRKQQRKRKEELQLNLTWEVSFKQYSCIIHSVLSPVGARPKWKTRVLFVPIISEPDFTFRSFPVAFQYPNSVALLFCVPFGYFLPLGEKKNHSLSEGILDFPVLKTK